MAKRSPGLQRYITEMRADVHRKKERVWALQRAIDRQRASRARVLADADRVIKRRPRRWRKPVTPEQHRALLNLTAQSGSLSRDKLAAGVRASYGISRRQLSEWLSRHPFWQRLQRQPSLRRETLKSIRVEEPNTHIQVDIGAMLTFGNANRGMKYFLLATDLFSRRIWIVPIEEASAANAAGALQSILDRSPLLSRYLRKVQTDNGGEFKAAFDRLLASRNVEHVWGEKGVPQTQGAVEVKIGHVRNMFINRMRYFNDLKWADDWREVEDHYNLMPSSSTGVPPERLDVAPGSVPADVRRYVDHHIDKMFARVDSRRRPTVRREEDELEEGDMVRVHIREKNPLRKSWQPRWSAKIYRITAVHEPVSEGGPYTYSLQGLAGRQARRSLVKVKQPFEIRNTDFDKPASVDVPVREQREAHDLQRGTAALLARNPVRGRPTSVLLAAGTPAERGGPAGDPVERGPLAPLIEAAGGGGAAAAAAGVYIEPERYGGRGQRDRRPPRRFTPNPTPSASMSASLEVPTQALPAGSQREFRSPTPPELMPQPLPAGLVPFGPERAPSPIFTYSPPLPAGAVPYVRPPWGNSPLLVQPWSGRQIEMPAPPPEEPPARRMRRPSSRYDPGEFEVGDPKGKRPFRG